MQQIQDTVKSCSRHLSTNAHQALHLIPTATTLLPTFNRVGLHRALELRNAYSSFRNDTAKTERATKPYKKRKEHQSDNQIRKVFSVRVVPAYSGLRSGYPARKPWQTQKAALKEKFSEQGWAPRKRLSPDALDGIRMLHKQDPLKNSTDALSTQFQVSPEAMRRILKSKWKPSEEEEDDRRRRWNNRGEQIWTHMVELGVKPPKKWREMGIARKPAGMLSFSETNQATIQPRKR